jgi:hypothetical protein
MFTDTVSKALNRPLASEGIRLESKFGWLRNGGLSISMANGRFHSKKNILTLSYTVALSAAKNPSKL